jgi:molecular chaperone IbpA
MLKLLIGGLDMRTNFDFTPYRRSTIGFDHLFDLLETSARGDTATYPPFDIEQESDDRYRITLAVAGFASDEIEIVAQNNLLTVSGRKNDGAGAGEQQRFLHRGIPTGPFERTFQLADFVVVEEARFDHGLLRIALKREMPEAMKPRRIAIEGSGNREGVVSAGSAANDRIEGPSPARDAA